MVEVKAALDPGALANYRLIPDLTIPSSLRFWRKLLPISYVAFFTVHSLFEDFQSGCQSTLTALVKATNDLLIALDIDLSLPLSCLDLQ